MANDRANVGPDGKDRHARLPSSNGRGRQAKERRGSIHRLRDGNVQYIGRTNNFDKRKSAHSRTPGKENLRLQPEFETQDYETVRGLEQYLYDVHSPILNEIRPISLRNGNIERYLEAACKFIGELG
ncbi:hypothetical protein ACFPN7_25480 [Amycolatopsis halotolerans]|uniref:hypothetical protein n=1 Tax=Amycolatopsis halotolerans TaxID=330083 RepID=UPI00361D00B7